MKRMKKVVAYSLLATMAISLSPIQAGAYGETSEKSTLVNDTSALEDYQTWKTSTWTGKESNDSSKIALTPGATAKDLNFAWYSEAKGTPAVKVGTKADLSDAKEYKGTASDINRSNFANTYKASNKVSITGVFEKNTTYYYSYTDDTAKGVWSDAEKYTTKDTSSYKIVVVGDPQVGASGSTGEGTADDVNIAVDTYNWNKTLTQVQKNDNDANFILSVGDQINYSNVDSDDTKNVRESEYAGFLYPEALRNFPLATVIGNHESKGTDYKYHYNNPNSTDNLGATNSGDDYYFSYGDVLYIMLNSNNRNASEHSALMEKAVASNPNAKWKVVAFHHDIYGSGQPHSDTDGANLRTIFAPLMDKFDIDICLTGHDHSYARTYQLVDGTAIDYGESVAVEPEGTLYIAAGSASGSKFYNLATNKQYYVAERSNNQLPTYSTLDITSGKLTIKTYDYNGNKYADDFTIVKKKTNESVQSLLASAASKTEKDYTATSWARLQKAVTAMNSMMAFTAEDKGAATLSATYDKTNDGDNAKDPLNYYGYAQGDYAVAKDNTKLVEGFSTLMDKTMVAAQIKKMTADTYEAAYTELVASVSGLEKAATTTKTDTSITTISSTDDEAASITLKKGSKTLKSSTTVKLKKGKSFKIKVTRKETSEDITYKSSNKKSVKVSSTGKVTAKKRTGKKVKITVTCGSLKKTFKVLVTKK